MHFSPIYFVWAKTVYHLHTHLDKHAAMQNAIKSSFVIRKEKKYRLQRKKMGEMVKTPSFNCFFISQYSFKSICMNHTMHITNGSVQVDFSFPLFLFVFCLCNANICLKHLDLMWNIVSLKTPGKNVETKTFNENGNENLLFICDLIVVWWRWQWLLFERCTKLPLT